MPRSHVGRNLILGAGAALAVTLAGCNPPPSTTTPDVTKQAGKPAAKPEEQRTARPRPTQKKAPAPRQAQRSGPLLRNGSFEVRENGVPKHWKVIPASALQPAGS